MTKTKDKHTGTFFLLRIALILPMAAWYGFAIKTTWGWFVVPLGVAHIGVWQAAGIYLLVRVMTMDTTLSRNEDKSAVEKFATDVSLSVLTPATLLGVGAIYHAFG